ncbi:MAG TPA: hypothetical protein VF766_11740 [Pyrinomonadaceae bacterium]
MRKYLTYLSDLPQRRRFDGQLLSADLSTRGSKKIEYSKEFVVSMMPSLTALTASAWQGKHRTRTACNT